MGLNANENKVMMGLENIHWWPLESETEEGVPTYGAVSKWPGAVGFTQTPVGDSDPFNADNGIYFMSGDNSGYEITLDTAKIPEDLEEYGLGLARDNNGLLIETDHAVLQPFALAGDLTGDKKARRVIFYKCFLKRPETAANTKTSQGNTPQTTNAQIVAVPRADVVKIKRGDEVTEEHLVKTATTASTSAEAYNAWYTTPQVPAFTIPTAQNDG